MRNPATVLSETLFGLAGLVVIGSGRVDLVFDDPNVTVSGNELNDARAQFSEGTVSVGGLGE